MKYIYKTNKKGNLYELLQYRIGYIFSKKLQSNKKPKSKRSVWLKSLLKNCLKTSEFNNIFVHCNILNLLK